MSMYFADTASQENPSKKMSKVAVVGLVHVVLGVGLFQGLSERPIVMPDMVEEMITLVPPKIVPPPPPPEPPKVQPKTVTPPKALVPQVEVEVEPLVEPEQAIQAEVMQESVPMAEPSTQGDAAPSTNSSADGTMRTAVFAEGCATPEYPARAARNGETGTVELALLVGADGRVTSSRVSKSSGSRDLDRAAVKALTLCKFQPAVNNGQAEAGWAQIAYVWTLKD
ncbi:MAG TPA: TonB family protein [Ramlibacter sp.]|nr:TonB family protein [Ramlibacter sp.]